MAVKWLEVYGAVISSTYMSMSRGVVDIKGAKEGLRRLLLEKTEDGEKPWRRFIIRSGDGSILEDTTDNPLKDFREFIEAQPLRGLGQSVADIERLLGEDAEALAVLREELVGPVKNWGSNQHAMEGNVGVDDVNSRRKAEGGNSSDYWFSRFKRDCPEEIEEIKQGKKTILDVRKERGWVSKSKRVSLTGDPLIDKEKLIELFGVEYLEAMEGQE
jgi:hypothetical protein